jgi:hypothetical protein
MILCFYSFLNNMELFHGPFQGISGILILCLIISRYYISLFCEGIWFPGINMKVHTKGLVYEHSCWVRDKM